MNIYEERDYLLDVIKQLQRDSRHLEDGLIDAHRVIRDYREIEQNATSTLDELVGSLDSMEKERDEARRWAAAWKQAAHANREDVICLTLNLESGMEYDRMLHSAIDGYNTYLEIKDRRIAELETIVANLRTPPGGLPTAYTPSAAPIQGVEDMYFTGESWQTEDE